MFEKLIYILAIVFTIFSFYKDDKKTKEALKEAIKSFENILPTVLFVMSILGVMLAILDKEFIAKLIGDQSGILGVIISSIIGSITMMAGFIAFPLGATLIKNGAGMAQIGAFISTIMMVGILTMPLEAKYFGKKITFLRNGLAFMFSFFVALVIGVIFR
ncbi:permease [Clostridiaceae bacterium 14S0207]|nr:permease [Clostridiaceae bacterium 14S0207]